MGAAAPPSASRCRCSRLAEVTSLLKRIGIEVHVGTPRNTKWLTATALVDTERLRESPVVFGARAFGDRESRRNHQTD